MHSYLIIELWILVVMWDNSISICGKDRPCRFPINTLQKKETGSPISVRRSLHIMQWNHIPAEASVGTRPWPSPLSSHHDFVNSGSFTRTPAISLRYRLTWLHGYFWVSSHQRNALPSSSTARSQTWLIIWKGNTLKSDLESFRLWRYLHLLTKEAPPAPVSNISWTFLVWWARWGINTHRHRHTPADTCVA